MQMLERVGGKEEDSTSSPWTSATNAVVGAAILHYGPVVARAAMWIVQLRVGVNDAWGGRPESSGQPHSPATLRATRCDRCAASSRWPSLARRRGSGSTYAPEIPIEARQQRRGRRALSGVAAEVTLIPHLWHRRLHSAAALAGA